MLSQKNNLWMLLHLTQMDVFERYMCLVNSPEYAYLDQNEPFPTLKVMISRKYSFQKLTQFSQENNVLDASPLNTDGVHSRGTCISSA
jgi:hypothetical protein